MSKAQLVITAVVLEGRSKSEVARDYDVSRHWVQQLCKRYDAEGAAAFEPRSRRPHRNPRAVGTDARRKDRAATQNAGPSRLRRRRRHHRRPPRPRPQQSPMCLRCPRSGGSCPAADSSPPSRTNDPGQHGSASKPTCPTNAGKPTSPTGASPTAPPSRSSTSSTTTPAWPSPATPGAYRQRPRRRRHLPAAFTDLGHSGHPAHRQRRHLHRPTPRRRPHRPGNHPGHTGHQLPDSRPYHPQTCGKVERFHQTLKKWLTAQPPAPTIAELQHHSTISAATTTSIRPHRALARRTPIQAYTARPKAVPTGTPSRRTAASATTASTPPASSPSATTAACTTSAWATDAGTNVPVLIDDRDIRVLTATPANSSANSSSTPTATTNHAASNAETHPKTGCR